MKLDATVMRTMGKTDFYVLSAVEKGMGDHSLVPAALIASIARLRHGGCHRYLSSLLRDKLLSHDRSCGYDGYRLTNSGYDVLALHHLKVRKVISALGDRIGTGKESDVYLAATPDGRQIVLKFHRLGRTSFRSVRKRRDYFVAMQSHHRHRGGGGSSSSSSKTLPHSWLFLSRMSALKEYAFLRALHAVGYPTPVPLAQVRHVVAMSLVRGVPLYQVPLHRATEAQLRFVYRRSLELCRRLTAHGLVHCDLNEFNLMVDMGGGVQSQSLRTGGAATVADDVDDDVGTHYVRHSGLPTAHAGALSTPQLCHDHDNDHQNDHGEYPMIDGTGERVTEDPPEPLERLEDGSPQPVVTLIDFPQMVSVRHPNADELFERDLRNLQRFFENKAKCDLSSFFSSTEPENFPLMVPVSADNEDGDNHNDRRLRPATLAEVMASLADHHDDDDDDNDDNDGGNDNNHNNNRNNNDWDDGVSLISSSLRNDGNDDRSAFDPASLAGKVQLRLDEQLRASGFSEADRQREMELFYYETSKGGPARLEEGDEDDDDEEEEELEIPDEQDLENHDDDDNDDDDDDDCSELQEPDVNDDELGTIYTETDLSTVAQLTESMARERVRRHLDTAKRNQRKKGAFRTRNSNKTFVHGRRIARERF